MDINAFASLRIAVVGDLVLDGYIDGAVGRLSPEAPVAVLLRQAERHVLGGAANVVANLAALGATVEVVGVVGADEGGARLRDLLGGLHEVDLRGLVVDPARPTTRKTRVMSGRHQIVRIDEEMSRFVADAVEEALVLAAERAIADADVVVLSDYAKGVCSDRVVRATVEAAARAGKPSIVDPKRRDFSIYRDATVIKPNRRELAEATGLPCESDAQAEAAARVVIAGTGSALLLTRSERGMSFVSGDGQALHLPTAARDVFDVSGAGDTVVAATALGFGLRRPVIETMRLANLAAGIVVGKIGTAVVTTAELAEALGEEAHPRAVQTGGLVTIAEALAHRERWRRQGLQVGFTNGCFDLLHPGHIALLQEAAAGCDRLVVAINTDASVRRLKGPSRPVQDEQSRAIVLGALRMVDLVVLFDEDTPRDVIGALVPDLLVKGADYQEHEIVGADVVKAAGGRVMRVSLVDGQSTSALIRRGRPSA